MKPAAVKNEATFRRTVLDPEGKAIAGAKVHLLKWNLPGKLTPDMTPPKVWAETDKDGRFSFTAPPYEGGAIRATAAGFAPGWDSKWSQPFIVVGGKPQETPSADFVVRLARDDVPLSGRLLDVQGEASCQRYGSVSPSPSRHHPTANSTNWIEAVKKRTLGEHIEDEGYLSSFTVDGLAHFFPPITTDKDGRHQIKGIGREQIADFSIDGPTIETRVIHVVTRPGVGVNDLRVPGERDLLRQRQDRGTAAETVLSADSSAHTADPGRVITGTVRDKDSGKPIAGASSATSSGSLPGILQPGDDR